MKTDWILAFVPTTFIPTLSLVQSNLIGSGDICVSRNCKQPPTIPATLSLAADLLSPLYEQFIPKTYEIEYGVKIDNICFTYFLQENQYLLYQSAVTEYGEVILYDHFEIDFPGRPGVIVGADTTCTYQEYTMQLGCGPIFITYRCFKFGECDQDFIPYAPGYDSFHGLSITSQVPYECQLEAIAQVYATPDFNSTELVPLPNQLNNKCVASVNGAKCLGYDKLDQNNSISIVTQVSQITSADQQQLLQLLGYSTP